MIDSLMRGKLVILYSNSNKILTKIDKKKGCFGHYLHIYRNNIDI